MSSEVRQVTLPANTLTYSEVHAFITSICDSNSMCPLSVTVQDRRGPRTFDYERIERMVTVKNKENITPGRNAPITSSPIFQYDEFEVTFNEGRKLQFITPELKEQHTHDKTCQ